MSPHQLDQGDAVLDAPRLSVRAVQHLGRFLDCGEVAKGPRDKGDVVIDGLGDADHCQGVSAALCFLKQIMSPALCAIAADREEHIHASADEVLHRTGDIHWPPRRSQHCAALLVDVVHELRCEHNRIFTLGRIKSLVTPAEAEHFLYAIGVMQLEEERANDVIQARTQPATGNNARASPLWIEEQSRAWASQLKKGSSRSRRLPVLHDLLRNTEVVTDCTLQWRGEPRFTQRGDCHKLIGTGSQAPTVFAVFQSIATSLFAVSSGSTATFSGSKPL